MTLREQRPLVPALFRQLLITALLLLGVSCVVFTILHLSPGAPLTVLEGQMSGEEQLPEAGNAIGPDGRHGRYLPWLFNLIQGNFGTSLRTGLPVFSEMLRTGVNTLILTVGSLLVTLGLAIPIALYSARRGMARVAWLTIFAYIISAVPVFWLAYIVIYFFTHKLGIFPLAGFSKSAGSGWVSLLLPIFVLGIGNGTISEVIRTLREEMSRVLAEDYIRTARAKGASIMRHAFKEGLLIPVTEIIASKIPFILGGAVIVEQVFNWPGTGRMAWQAAQDRDYPVIMGITILAAVFVRLGRLFKHVVYVMVDPRASGK